MSARSDLISAGRSLHVQGHNLVSPQEVIDEARKLGSTYADATLRSMIVHHMRIDRGPVVGGIGFLQVSRGLYRLASISESDPQSVISEQGKGNLPIEISNGTGGESTEGHQWFWEGNVQSALVRHLASDGWRIRRVADTHSREHGIDIEADRNDVSLLIEVKGYPSATYRSGSNKGQKKSFGVATQARNYFGNAVLTGLLMRTDNDGARVVLAFPTQETFRGLARRSAGPLRRAGIEIWLVDEQGRVSEVVEIDNQPSKFEWRPEDVVILGADDGDTKSDV